MNEILRITPLVTTDTAPSILDAMPDSIEAWFTLLIIAISVGGSLASIIGALLSQQSN